MNEEKKLLQEIREARKDPRRTDRFIEKYTPFIRSEVSRYASAADYAEKEDALSVALFAFYEALMNYESSKGAFFPLARVYIRNRLIDMSRRESREETAISLDDDAHDDGKTTLLDTVPDESASPERDTERECTREEIEDFTKALSEYGLTLNDIAESCPRQQRTMQQCIAALEYAKTHRDILDSLTRTKKLPLGRLVKEGGFDRKTLERHRKYLVGIFLAFTNGFVIIRGHLCHMKEDGIDRS